LYAIVYALSTGTTTHRSKSATAAIEEMELLRMGGGRVIKIVENLTGRELSVPELQLLARRELTTVDPTTPKSGPRFPWRRPKPSG
jgi:hypothetical protein